MFMAPHLMNAPADGATVYVDRELSQIPVTTAGASETRTLAQPTKAGLICTVVHDTDGGDFTLTVTGGYNQDGDTTIAFADAGDFVTFISQQQGSSFYWRILSLEGVVADKTGFMQMQREVLANTTTTAVAITSEVTFLTGDANGRTYALPNPSVGPRVALLNKTTATFVLTCHTTGVSIDGATSLGIAAAGAAGGQLEAFNDGTNWYAILGG
jgi:hypothetical protein